MPLSCYWELIFTKPSNWNNMLQTGWKNDLMTTTAMLSHQNVVEIVHSLYLSKRESRCRMPSQFGAGGNLWTEWHHGLKYVYILRSLTTIKEGDWVLLLFLLILFAGAETRLYHDLSLTVVINGTHATADIDVKVISLCWVRNEYRGETLCLHIP